MEKQFITSTYDKFAEKTTTISKPHKIIIGIDVRGKGMRKYQIGLRHIKSPDINALVIDVLLNTPEWVFIRSGKIIIKTDNEKFEVDAVENYSKVLGHQKVGDSYQDLGQEESVFYKINQEILKKICDSESFEMRITADGSYFDFVEGNKLLINFKTMCKQFYNNFYDSSEYVESLNVKVKNPGCFIATAALGDYNHPIVMDLRLFRDNWLLKREWGVQFTSWYYTHGPKAASVIEKSTVLKKLTFFFIVKPLQVITKNFR